MKQRVKMLANHRNRYAEPICYGVVRHPLRHQRQNLTLTRRKFRDWLSVAEYLFKLWRYVSFTAGNVQDCMGGVVGYPVAGYIEADMQCDALQVRQESPRGTGTPRQKL